MKKAQTLLTLLLAAQFAQAQMWNGQDTLYGNEWIDFAKIYHKIRVADDGVYRIAQPLLTASGLGAVPGSQLRLYRNGQQVPLFVGTDGPLGAADFVEFFGEANRNELDRHLFEDPERDNLNPRYSLFSDTAAYYLSWAASGPALRHAALPNDLTNLPPKETFVWQTAEQVFVNAHSKKRLSDELDNSFFDGNGFSSAANYTNSNTVPLPKRVAEGPPATVTVRYACGIGAHRQQVWANDSLLATDEFSGWKVLERSFALPLSQLGNSPVLKVASTIGGNDPNAVAFFRVRYPRQLDFEGGSVAEFRVAASATAQYFEIQGFNVSGGGPVLYDLTQNLRLVTSVEAGVVKFKLPPHGAERRLFLANASSGVKSVTALRPLQFRDYAAEPANYVVIAHRAFWGAAAEYAAYRESLPGGNWKVAVADVDELYEQFAYGVRYHPIALRNFLHFFKKKQPALSHCFLVGKGLDYTRFRDPAAQAALADSLFFVPTFSTPAADLPFAMQGARVTTPIVAIGRLAVTKPVEVSRYLQKVKEHEQQLALAPQSIEGRAWMKRVIHNSGGFNAENALIRAYTSEMANTLINSRFGADVYPYYKTSNDPIQLSSYEQMLGLINGGVSLWTIFGHSSPFAVDFDIGLPTNYHNKGRYPMLMVMGCFSGLCSLPQQGIGEQFLLAPDRGVIAYIASVNYGFIHALHLYGQKYYELLGGADYGKTIGEVMQHSVRDLRNTGDLGLRAIIHQNLMQGDPAIRLHPLPGPDFVVDHQRVEFNPNPVGLESPAFQMKFDLVNIGQNPGGQVALKIEQRRPDNTVFLRKLDTIPAPPNRRTLEYALPTAGSRLGFNRFFVTADPDNQVAELPAAAELNNDLTDATGERGVDVYFYADDVQPISPQNYGVVKAASVPLRASTLNTNAARMRYLFEFDTVETFDSPLRKSAVLEQRGGLLEWTPPLPLTDSTVYWWRVARDSLVNGQVLWRSRSFVRLAQAEQPGGWNQSRYAQYRDGTFANLVASDSLRRLEFAANAANTWMNVAYRDAQRYPGFQNAYYEGFIGDYGWNVRSVNDGVVMVLSDPNTGRFVRNPAGGPFNHSATNEFKIFWFSTRDSLQRLKLMDFLETQIPPGYVVGLLAFSRPNDPVGYAPQQWAKDSVTAGRNIFQVLEKNGATLARQMLLPGTSVGPRPYGILFRKGDPFTPVREALVSHPDSTTELRLNFTAKWTSGILETPAIGPARAWRSLHWQRDAFDDPSDRAALEVLALREGLPDTLLFSLKNTFDTTLAALSAAQFPLLKLRYDAGDTLRRTLTQPRYLRLLYEGLPEGTLHPAAQFDFYRDTLQQGETLRASIAFVNVSDAPMDSVLVKFRIENSGTGGSESLRRYGPLPVGGSLTADFQAPTLGIAGPQRWSVEVNPNADQPELYHFNNVALRDFYVSRDRRNPLLDVTFDGAHLLDGDIVSPQPVVSVSLKDDNPYLAMSDTATFALQLELPDGSRRSIRFSDPDLTFFPAEADHLPQKNLARLEWRPRFTLDGDYRLLVNGRDASGNASAALDWAVRFRVITKSSLSNVLNYPNPFSTSTCFVYTLTGAEPPAHFKIQIMTVSGRVVREITEAEFGPLRTGTHRSDFCWDGRDEYGDQLANGVYLYRVSAKKADGADFELFENQGQDGFFKHGFGKMVLMR
jgi:hypothetical protein